MYHYVFRFDGDAVHAPAEVSADVTVERRPVSLGLNVWSDPHGTGHVYAHLSNCHTNCLVVLSVSSGTKPPREIARVEVPVGGGFTPTLDFKRKGATTVYASYAGDDWFLPAEAVWSSRFPPRQRRILGLWAMTSGPAWPTSLPMWPMPR